MTIFMWIVFSLAWGFLGLFFTEMTRRYALKHLLDIPNDRSAHQIPTPRGGGLAIAISFLLGLWGLWAMNVITGILCLSLAICSSAVAIIGWLDDHYNLSAKLRLVIHFSASAFLLITLFCSLNSSQNFSYSLLDSLVLLLGFIILLCAMVYFLNLYNFMDGIDGIAGMETLFLGISFILLTNNFTHLENASILGLLLALSSCGFLYFNWPKAKIFMGDIGSGFIGFILVALAIINLRDDIFLNAPYPDLAISTIFFDLSIFLVLSASFWCDTTLTLIKRIKRKQSPLKGHSEHAYQHLSRYFNKQFSLPLAQQKTVLFAKLRGNNPHQMVVLIYLAINLFWLLPIAILIRYEFLASFIGLLIASCPILLFFHKLGAGKPVSP